MASDTKDDLKRVAMRDSSRCITWEITTLKGFVHTTGISSKEAIELEFCSPSSLSKEGKEVEVSVAKCEMRNAK
jgi:hypothetical protein